VQKVRNSLDQLLVALLLNDPVFSVDGSGKVQPSAWIIAAHALRACLVVGDVDETSARVNALDAEIDARLRGRTSGGQGFEAPYPILATLGERGLGRLMFEYCIVFCAKPDAPYDTPINLPYDTGSYMAQLYAVDKDHLDESGPCKVCDMETCKAFRDFLCKWCHVWSSLMEPFRGGDRKNWTHEDWRAAQDRHRKLRGPRRGARYARDGHRREQCRPGHVPAWGGWARRRLPVPKASTCVLALTL
jgi:hypothetical protein